MQRVVVIGAPFGRFFRFLAPRLEQQGVQVWRVVFDGGDLLGTPLANAILYRETGNQSDWEAFLERILREKLISGIVTFNDSCRRTRAAHAAAEKLGIARYVLEEGYLRPWWVTFDREGVNGNSLLPQDPSFYLAQTIEPVPHTPFTHSFRYLVRDTIVHFVASTLASPVLPYDPSYYGDSVWTQAKGYTREYIWRKLRSDRSVLRHLRTVRNTGGCRVFTALMQKPGDAQLRHHSDFGGNNPYLETVLRSFAANAAPDDVMVVKQHPLDYGVERSWALFNRLVDELGLEGRAFYIRKLTIESVLAVTDGLITINSTGGLASIEKGVATIALGRAIYDMPGLTFQDGIDRFWSEYSAPRPDVVEAFVTYLKSKTQINGGFYSRTAMCLLADNMAAIIAQGAWAPHHGLTDRAQRSRAPASAPPVLPLLAPVAAGCRG